MTLRGPIRRRRKPIPPCENVELEFTERMLSLFASFYDTPLMDLIVTFPPAPEDESRPRKDSPQKTAPFYSGVWDLRLEKALESRRSNDKSVCDSLTQQLSKLRDSIASESPDITEIFAPHRVERPAIPRYIQNLMADRQAAIDSFRPRQKSRVEDLGDLRVLFTNRVARQKAIAKARRENRFAKAKLQEKQHKEFVRSLHHAKRPEDIDIKTAVKNRTAKIDEERQRIARNTEELLNSPVIRKYSPSSNKSFRADPRTFD
jgi:hypothetical protein